MSRNVKHLQAFVIYIFDPKFAWRMMKIIYNLSQCACFLAWKVKLHNLFVRQAQYVGYMVNYSSFTYSIRPFEYI
ncbi:hypothetical protein JCM15764A_27940 [Geotalea toluenoxydans]